MQRTKSRTKLALRNIGTSFVVRLIKTVLTFVVRTVFIYTLGKTYLGINGVFTSILNMLALTELGFGTTIVFHLYKPLAYKDDKRVRILLKFYKFAYRIVGFVILGIGLCLIPLLPYIIRDYNSLDALGINVTIVFVIYLLQSAASYLLFAYRQTVIEADQRKYIVDIVGCGKLIIESILQILALVFLQDFVVYLLCSLLCTVIFNIVNGGIARYYYPDFFVFEEEQLKKHEIFELLKDCGAMFLFRIESVVLKATANMVLSIFSGLAIVGIYSSYLLIINALRGFLEKFYSSVKHSMGNLYAVGNIEEKFRFFEIMNFITVILYGITSIGLIVCSNEFILAWIGSDYILPQPFPFLIGIEMLFDGLVRNLTQIRNISGAFRQLWYRPILSIVVNVVTSVFLVQYYGINGVIIGGIFSYLFVGMVIDTYIVMKVCLEDYKTVSFYYKKNLGYIIVLFLVGIINYSIANCLLFEHRWFSFFFHGIVIVLTVPSVFFIIYHDTEECVYILNLIKKILHKNFSPKRINF